MGTFLATLRKRWLIIVAAIVVLGVVTVSYLQSAAPKEVPAIQVQREDVTASLTVTGQVEAHTDLEISAPVTARIEEITVDEGSSVSAGQVVVRLNQADVRAAVSESRARLAQAQASLQRLRRGTRAEEVGRLRAATGETRTTIAQTQADLASAQATLEEAQRNAQRLERLFREGAVSAQEYEQATTRLQTAEANVNRLQAAVRATRFRVTQSREQLAQAVAGPTREEIAEAEAARQAAAEAVRQAEAQLAERVIRSATNGVVTERVRNAGDLAVPGQPLLRIANRNTLEVIANVEEADLGRVSVGSQAFIVLDSQPDRPVKAVVRKIGSRVNPENGTVPVTVIPSEASPFLLPGMTADVNIITARLRDSLIVPVTAVETVNGQANVLLIRDGRVVRRPVQIRRISLENVQILSGLQPGDWVASEAEPAHLELKRVKPKQDVKRVHKRIGGP